MKLNELSNYVCPVFWQHEDAPPHQIGSAVLLRIVNHVFLLTAAHVSDFQDEGDLLIPGKDHLTYLRGYFAQIPVPAGSSRSQDKVDIAYYRLLPDLATSLHPTLKVLTREDVFMCDQLDHRDLYSFVGYPWRRSTLRGHTHETEFFTYTGGAMPSETYSRLGYDSVVHVLIRFQRKKSFSFQRKLIGTAPLPDGISGGGVFAWPKDVARREDEPELKLVGIAHTYHEQDHCMAATRINTYVACILRNNPELQPAELKDSATRFPDFLGMVWYAREEWRSLRESFADADMMHDMGGMEGGRTSAYGSCKPTGHCPHSHRNQYS